MAIELISLDEASRRLEKSEISGRAFAELLAKIPSLLLGILPRNEVRDLVDLSRVTSFRAEPENVVIADNVKWTDIKLDWRQGIVKLSRRDRLTGSVSPASAMDLS
jgi:hypothetical protein